MEDVVVLLDVVVVVALVVVVVSEPRGTVTEAVPADGDGAVVGGTTTGGGLVVVEGETPLGEVAGTGGFSDDVGSGIAPGDVVAAEGVRRCCGASLKKPVVNAWSFGKRVIVARAPPAATTISASTTIHVTG